MRLEQRARAERCKPERGRKDTRTHAHIYTHKKKRREKGREREREKERKRERERKKINWTKGMTSRQSVRKSFEQRLEKSSRQREKGT